MDAYLFWKRIDSKRKDIPLTTLATKAGLSYKNIKDQRSLNRLPKLEDAYALATTLDVSIEYLLTGETPSTYTPRTPQVKAIFEAILHATQAELDIIYRIVVKEDPAETHTEKRQA